MTREHGWRVTMWGGAAMLLMAPLAAMQVSAQVDWSGGDFVAFAALLALVCVSGEVIVRRRLAGPARAGAALAIATGFLLLWSNLAVGIAESETNAINVLFLLLPLVALGGMALARLEARASARVLTATATAQLGSGLVAAWAGWPEAAIISAGFAALWLLAAWLFRRNPPAPNRRAERRSD